VRGSDVHGAEREVPPERVVAIRAYTDADYPVGRALWVELTEYHRRLYEDPTIGGDDPGGALDAYLADPARVGSWVAVLGARVVGLTGLFERGQGAEIEPVVVLDGFRGEGIGRRLLRRAVDEAAARGFEYAAVRPVARNDRAIRSFYGAGFRTLGGHVDLTIDLTERRHVWRDGVRLHGLEFKL
jgi:GNAT superfamily N-acetyltransferase